MIAKVSVYQIQAILDTSVGFFKKIGVSTPPTINIPMGMSVITQDIDAYMYIYVMSKKDILECELNFPMMKVVLIQQDLPLCDVWLHFNPSNKLNITSDNFNEYIDQELLGYFSVDVYKNGNRVHMTLDTLGIFIGSKKVVLYVIDLIQTNIQKIIDI